MLELKMICWLDHVTRTGEEKDGKPERGRQLGKSSCR